MIKAILVETLESTPGEDTHWATRAMANKHGISHQAVAEIQRASGLKPCKEDSYKTSPDPQLVDNIRHLVGLHTRRSLRCRHRKHIHPTNLTGH